MRIDFIIKFFSIFGHFEAAGFFHQIQGLNEGQLELRWNWTVEVDCPGESGRSIWLTMDWRIVCRLANIDFLWLSKSGSSGEFMFARAPKRPPANGESVSMIENALDSRLLAAMSMCGNIGESLSIIEKARDSLFFRSSKFWKNLKIFSSKNMKNHTCAAMGPSESMIENALDSLFWPIFRPIIGRFIGLPSRATDCRPMVLGGVFIGATESSGAPPARFRLGTPIKTDCCRDVRLSRGDKSGPGPAPSVSSRLGSLIVRRRPSAGPARDLLVS